MTASTDPLIISGMKENNAPHEARVRDFLTAIVREPQRHALFMNMLSMLEHIGSRKIMLSQMDKHDTLDQDTLQHLSEEARHAYFFKRHAERIAGKALPGWTDENTMCRVPALMYFGRMDAGITKRINQSSSRWRASQEALARTGSGKDGEQSSPTYGSPPSKHAGACRGDDREGNDPYPWVSLIIELRACWLYRIYNEAIEEAGIHLPLKSLIAEEDHHLAEMYEACDDDGKQLRELSRYETKLFEALWAQLEGTASMRQVA